MPTLADLLALAPDNTANEISPADLREIIRGTYRDQITRVLDERPDGTPHALDDEFDSDTLDAAWVANAPATGSIAAGVKRGAATIEAQCGSDDATGLLKPLGALTFPLTIEAGFFVTAFNQNYAMRGMMFADGLAATDNTVTSQKYDITFHAQAGTWTSVRSIGLSAAGSFDPDLPRPFEMHRLVWKNANEWAALYSNDFGMSWSRLNTGSPFAAAVTPTYVGVFASTWGGAQPMLLSVPFFRVYEADLDVEGF